MENLLECFNTARDSFTRLLLDHKIIMSSQVKLKVDQILHDCALNSFRVGHVAGSELRAKQISEICGQVFGENIRGPKAPPASGLEKEEE